MQAEEVEVTVLFCDMAGFTARTENMEPHDVLVLLNRCFSHMTEVVQEHGGTVDKYIGDCLMAVFGAPFPQPDHARRAALAALGVRDVVGRSTPRATGRGGFPHRHALGPRGGGRRRPRDAAQLDGPGPDREPRLAHGVLGGQHRPDRPHRGTRAGLGDEFEPAADRDVRPPKGITREFQAFELLGLRGEPALRARHSARLMSCRSWSSNPTPR